MRPIATGKRTPQPRGNPDPTVRMVRPTARAMGLAVDAIATRVGVVLAQVGPGVPVAGNDKHRVRAKVKALGRLPVHRATQAVAVQVTGVYPVRAIWASPVVGEVGRGLTVAIKINGKTVCPAVSNLIR
jgi:hypothetical protein